MESKIKITKDLDLASGFFSDTHNFKNSNLEKKKTGGRPKKEGLKNSQFTLTMDPILYEKIKIIAKENTQGNISKLFSDAITHYCTEKRINLQEIKISENTLKKYLKKQIKS